MMSELVGRWDLRRYAHIADEVSTDGDNSGIQAWLRGLDDNSPESGDERTGLQLLIRDGIFSESVQGFTSLMFDREGIQVNDYQPMSGNVVIIKGIAYLIPEGVAEDALHDAGDCALRYDDGDTMVCDTIRVFGDTLVRQLSVVTDELYLDRMTLVYGRSTDVA